MKDIIKENTVISVYDWKVIYKTTNKNFYYLVKNIKVEVENDKKLVKKLVFLMKKYADKIWETHEKVKNILLKKYNIRSRKELSNDQLNMLIDSYKFWLQEE